MEQMVAKGQLQLGASVAEVVAKLNAKLEEPFAAGAGGGGRRRLQRPRAAFLHADVKGLASRRCAR